MPRQTRERPDADERFAASEKTRRPRRRSLVIVVCAAVCVIVAAVVALETTGRQSKHATSPQPLPSPKPASAAYFVAPGGNGKCASVSAPCGTINAAVDRAKKDHADGAVIQLAAGSYPAQTVDAIKNTADADVSVVVRAAPSGNVSLDSLTLNAAHVTINGITITGPAKIKTSAVASGFDNITTDGGSVYLGASGSFLKSSRVKPAVDEDGVQIKAYGGEDPDGVTVEHTVIGPGHRGPKRTHVDCIQILGGSDIVIRYDKLFHCGAEGIIAGSGAGGHVAGPINIQRNDVQLCPQRTDDCDGYDAIDMNAPKVTFVHNTVIDGGAVFRVENGLTIAGNYFDDLKTCIGTIEANLVGSTDCHLPPGNRTGHLDFSDVDASPPDLTPRAPVVLPNSAQWVGGAFSTTDLNGRHVDPSSATVGAAQVAS